MALPVRVLAGVLACAFLLVVPAFAQGAENLTPQLADTPDIAHAKYDGVQHLQYKYGPVPIQAGQNNIEMGKGQVPKPKVDGWITRMQPNLELMDGTIPPVDVIHLHHAVWYNASHPGVAPAATTTSPPSSRRARRRRSSSCRRATGCGTARRTSGS